jgi:hypothetical protein
VDSSAALQAAETLSLFASRQRRTSSLGGPCFLPAQYFGMSSLQAVATGPVCAAATAIAPTKATKAAKNAVINLMFTNSFVRLSCLTSDVAFFLEILLAGDISARVTLFKHVKTGRAAFL